MSGSHRGGSHRTASGSYRNSEGSGGYSRGPGESHPSAGGSGSYRGGSGSHRIVHNRPPRRRAAVLAGAVGGVAVCILAVFVVLGVLSNDNGKDASGGITNSGATTGDTAGPGTELAAVPDACEMVSDKLAGALAPSADRTQSDTYQANDRANQCVWGAYTGANKRALTVELRAIAGTGGRSGADAAGRTFLTERQADESGKGLLPTQRLIGKRTIPGLGEEAYVVYALDSSQNSGEAIVNIRAANVLVTVHYSGGGDKDALAQGPAIDGAVAAAKETVTVLGQAK